MKQMGFKHIWEVIFGTKESNFHPFQQSVDLWGIKNEFHGHSTKF
jgi:hypothetical protein